MASPFVEPSRYRHSERRSARDRILAELDLPGASTPTSTARGDRVLIELMAGWRHGSAVAAPLSIPQRGPGMTTADVLIVALGAVAVAAGAAVVTTRHVVRAG